MSSGAREPGREVGVLLERERELAALRGAVRAAGVQAGTLVVVHGPPGLGKTSLLEAGVALARSAGLRVLTGRGRELERTVGLGVAVDLLAPVVHAAGPAERARLLDGLAAAAAPLLLEPAGELAMPADAALLGLCWVAAHTAGWNRRAEHLPPLLMAVDDLQWADPPSLRFLAMLADRVERLPMCLLVAIRDGEPPVADDTAGQRALAYLATHPRARLLSPAALSTAAVAELIGTAFPGGGPRLASAVAHAGGGNPFLTAQLVHALRAGDPAAVHAGDPAAADVVGGLAPEAVMRSILGRLGRMPEAAGRLAASLAVLGDGTALRRAATHADLAPAAAEHAADLLSAAHLLRSGDPLCFNHPLIGVAVHASLPSFARARAHRRAAELMAADGESADKVAGQLLDAGPEGDQGSVAVLDTAARHALQRGDPAAAVRLLRRALAEPPRAADRPALLARLAHAQLTSGDEAADEPLVEALRLLPPSEVHARAAALALLARVHHARGHLGPAADASGRALDLLAPEDPVRQDALAEYLTVATFHPALRADTRRRLAPLLAGVRGGRPPGRPALAACLTLWLALECDPPAAVRASALAALAADPLVDADDHGTLFALVAHALVMAGEIDAAEAASTAAMQTARRRSDLLALGSGAFHRALARYRRGALTPALADLHAARAVPDAGWRGAAAWHHALAAELHLDLTGVAASRRELRQAEAPAAEAMDVALIGHARARLALAEHDPGTAMAAATAAGEHLELAFGIDHPGLLPWRIPAALAAHRLGDHEQAGRLAAAALDRARRTGVGVAVGVALRVTGVVAHPGPDTAALAESVQALRGSVAALEYARSLVELGAALRRTGRRGAAVSPLREGLALADRLRAVPLAERARTELTIAGVRPRRAAVTGINALTHAEQRVALLALHGNDNTTIAQTLFITTKTVETHLTRAYRKLGIAGRRQLADVFGAAPGPPAGVGGGPGTAADEPAAVPSGYLGQDPGRGISPAAMK